MASRLAEIAIRKHIASKSDIYYETVQSLGEIAWGAFGEGRKSQIRNLENVANSASGVAEILDFVKRQTGRSRPTSQWRYEDFGHELLRALDGALRKDAQSIFDEVKEAIKRHELSDDDRRRIHVLLCREFIRHLSSHYLYKTGLTVGLGGLWKDTKLSEEDLNTARRDVWRRLGDEL